MQNIIFKCNKMLGSSPAASRTLWIYQRKVQPFRSINGQLFKTASALWPRSD